MKTYDSQADGMTLRNRVFIFIDKNHLLILIIPKIRIVNKKNTSEDLVYNRR